MSGSRHLDRISYEETFVDATTSDMEHVDDNGAAEIPNEAEDSCLPAK